MRLEKYLKEEYLMTYIKTSMPGEIYLNPTTTEIKSLKYDDYLRGLADCEKKNFFLWSDFVSVHVPVIHNLMSKGIIKRDDDFKDDFASYRKSSIGAFIAKPRKDGKLYIEGSVLNSTLDWKWLNKYFININTEIARWRARE